MRSGRGTRGTRGRGRGRGARAGSAAASARQTENPTVVPEAGPDTTATTEAAPSLSAPETAPTPLATPTTTSAGEAHAADREFSQAATSSSTPAAASVANRSSSATVAPARSASSTAPNQGARMAGGSKFRPKGVRRGEAERARLAEEQLEIQIRRDAEDARLHARANRFSSRGRGRGRGGFFDRIIKGSTASGPLAQGIGSYGTSSAGSYRNVGGGGGSSSGVRGSGGPGPAGGYGMSGGVDDRRINADSLYGMHENHEDGDESTTTSAAAKKKPVLPMGTRRIEHKEEKVHMASTAEIEAQEQGAEHLEEEDDDDSGDSDLWVKDPNAKDEIGAEIAEDEKVWDHAVPKTQGKVRVKKEDGQIVETMDIDEIATGQIIDQDNDQEMKTPDSPDEKKKDKGKLPEPVPTSGSASVVADSISKPGKKRRGAPPKDLESEMMAEDLEYMLRHFTMQASGAGKGTSTDADAGPGASTRAGTTSGPLDGQLFLWQFPPVLPPLKVKKRPAPKKDLVKDEPNDDVVMLNQPQHGTKTSIDLTGEDAKMGDEDDDDSDNEADYSSPFPKEGGYVGQLLVRKSGKVELDWGGGCTLEMVPGTQMQFLSTAVILEDADEKVQPGQLAGKAYGMGKIQGKFVLAPRWAEEEDWVVDPRNLEIPEGLDKGKGKEKEKEKEKALMK